MDLQVQQVQQVKRVQQVRLECRALQVILVLLDYKGLHYLDFKLLEAVLQSHHLTPLNLQIQYKL